jgi:hypothetical protein
MLGADFPGQEIDAIIAETSGTNGKISYAEFLAQWEDGAELVQEQLIGDVLLNESTDQISVLSSEESYSGDHTDIHVARVNFIGRKGVSERKLLKCAALEEKSPMRDSTRRVMFQQSADQIAD